ncbi:hypothetical protein HYV50_02410 [Candidatus Pacearchaeota archaeon]|nr:hypothetical protein [Candidatus Pacearchaeota archaeon]
MWSVEAFEPRRALAFEVPANTCGIGGVASSCGDNVLDAGEQCDDGNNLNDDGCSATCRLEKACELDWAVNQETPIWISCRDPVPHPVDHEKIGFRISFEDPPFLTERYCEEFGGEFDGDSGLCWIHENEFHFNFLEDSIHDLEFFCEDALGNVGEADVEFFAVDTKPPVIEKTIVGPSVGECPPQDQDDVCIIDGVTKIHVEAKDQEPHPVGGVQCGYEFTVDGGDPRITKDPLTPPFDIQFGEPSEHVLTITCWDALGNEVNDTETFLVDKTLPVIEKTIGDPQFSCYDWCAAECGGDESCWQECLYGEDSICEFNNKTGEWFPQWITNTTSIWAFAFDPEPHPSGLNSLSWRVRRVNDSACRSIALCNGTQGSGEWNSVEGDEAQAHFEISEESCHLIEIMATDNVNKTSIHKQCVFVDTSPPEPNKTVSEPKDRWTPGKNGDPNSTFYPAETRHCWDGTGQSIDCWQVTTLTPITLDCTETGPHPVNHEKVYFKVDFDGDDKTGDYCQDVNGTLQDNGYCLVDGQEAPFTLYFNEESEHNLKFYCEDALGNRGSIDEEKFKVEGSAFNITLYKKWNLISVPFVLVNNDPDTVFESIKEDVKAVWSYDAESDNWDAWRPGENLTNTLNEIKPGWGYWIEMKNESVLIIGGSLFSPAVTPPSRPMVPGWNLIGYYGNKDINGDAVLGHDCVQVPEGKEAICSLNSLVDTVIGRPRWSSLWTYCEAIAPVDKFISLNEHQQMTPGAGYWLEMDIEDSYAPATTCSGLI